jgi:predicted dehydrogenase
MHIGLIGVGRIGAFHASTLRGLPEVDALVITDADTSRARRAASPCPPEDALEAFYVAEARELSRHRQQPVLTAEVRR